MTTAHFRRHQRTCWRVSELRDDEEARAGTQTGTSGTQTGTSVTGNSSGADDTTDENPGVVGTDDDDDDRTPVADARDALVKDLVEQLMRMQRENMDLQRRLAAEKKRRDEEEKDEEDTTGTGTGTASTTTTTTTTTTTHHYHRYVVHMLPWPIDPTHAGYASQLAADVEDVGGAIAADLPLGTTYGDFAAMSDSHRDVVALPAQRAFDRKVRTYLDDRYPRYVVPDTARRKGLFCTPDGGVRIDPGMAMLLTYLYAVARDVHTRVLSPASPPPPEAAREASRSTARGDPPFWYYHGHRRGASLKRTLLASAACGAQRMLRQTTLVPST